MNQQLTQSLRDWSDESIRASYPPARIVKNKFPLRIVRTYAHWRFHVD